MQHSDVLATTGASDGGSRPGTTSEPRLLDVIRSSTPVAAGTSKLTYESIGALLGAYEHAGGKVLDTARNYGDGHAEAVLGSWLRARGRRDDLVVLTKGGHPGPDWVSRLTLRNVRSDLEESLFQLGVDHVDVYLLHRDDEFAPVEELLGILEQIRASGKARWIGVSNWRAERLREALASPNPPALVSNHFGLGVPAGPATLPGVVSTFDPQTHGLLDASRVPLLAWSSMSAGYFSAPAPTRAVAVSCGRDPLSVRRNEVLTAIAEDFGRAPDAVLTRWLATAAPHLVPIIGTTRPERMAALMAAAADTGLDAAVAELITRLSTGVGGPGAARLLLPSSQPAW